MPQHMVYWYYAHPTNRGGGQCPIEDAETPEQAIEFYIERYLKTDEDYGATFDRDLLKISATASIDEMPRKQVIKSLSTLSLEELDVLFQEVRHQKLGS